MTFSMRFIWWHDFRVIYSENEYLLAMCQHPQAYAPLLTTKGRPGNRFTNAYAWNGPNATTLIANDTFPDTATGCGQQYANAYLHTMRFKFNKLDGSIPFVCWPNAWGFALADNTNTAANSANWLAERDPWFVRLGRNDADLLPATYLSVTVDPRGRGASGYTAGGIAANYTWWTDFFVAAKAYIDTALGHTNTPLEIYDGIDYPLAPDLNYILARITTGELVHRVFDVIRADARWSTELVNGTQTWADFYATLTSGERAQLEDTANTSLFGDALTTVAEKLGVFRDTCTVHQVEQSLVRAAKDIFDSRLKFVCEYRIQPETSAKGTINDRTVSAFTDRLFENRGPLTLPAGWGAAPIGYQLFGLRDAAVNASGGNLDKYASVMGYTRTGSGLTGGAAADGRLFNIARSKENIRRIRDLGAETVPWWNYIPATGTQSGIIATTPMTTEDHLDVLQDWSDNGVNRLIIWGDPARDFNDDPLDPPLVDYYESDFKTIIEDILPKFTEYILHYRRQPNVPTVTGSGPWTSNNPLVIDSGKLGLAQLKAEVSQLETSLGQTVRVKDISPTRFGLTKKVQRRLNYP